MSAGERLNLTLLALQIEEGGDGEEVPGGLQLVQEVTGGSQKPQS